MKRRKKADPETLVSLGFEEVSSEDNAPSRVFRRNGMKGRQDVVSCEDDDTTYLWSFRDREGGGVDAEETKKLSDVIFKR